MNSLLMLSKNQILFFYCSTVDIFRNSFRRLLGIDVTNALIIMNRTVIQIMYLPHELRILEDIECASFLDPLHADRK